VTKGEVDLFSSYPSERIGCEMGTRVDQRGVEVGVMKGLLVN